MKITSANEHLAQMNTMKDISSHICLHVNFLLADDSCGKNRKEVGGNMERRDLRTERPGPEVPCFGCHWNEWTKMHAHARAQTSIHTYMKGNKKSDVTRLPAQAANSSGASKTASSDHFHWKWWQSERAVSIESQCAAVWQTSGPL